MQCNVKAIRLYWLAGEVPDAAVFNDIDTGRVAGALHS